MTDPQPTGRPNARMRQTVGDMVRSLVVVLAVVVVILVFAWRPDPDPVKVVDPAPYVSAAVAQAGFSVQAPALPDGWRPTSARWKPTAKSESVPALHIGYVTPSDQYAQVVQSAQESEAFVREQTADGLPTGQTLIEGTTWQLREGGERRSLMLVEADHVTIVSGSADWPELTELARSLAPAG